MAAAKGKLKVAVGLSGGVDSAVAALLVKQQGHETVGVFMQNWDEAVNNDVLGNKNADTAGPCQAEQDYAAAQAVAQALDIPLFRVDFIQRYWDEVFAHFLAEYKRGRTPNPDVLCNKQIKFGAFLDHCLNTLGCDLVATGHYARIVHGTEGAALFKARDLAKDQTYFLAQLSQAQLAKVLFPIGGLLKGEVRARAKASGLPNHDRPDSTGICFIGERRLVPFLQNYIPAAPGAIVDAVSGRVLGRHAGAMYYTIGQRRGLALGGQAEKCFVVGRELKTARLYVAGASHEREFLESDACAVSRLNWIGGTPPLDKNGLKAKFRYRQRDVPVRFSSFSGEALRVEYPEGVLAVAAGQQIVFYDGERCLGGGTVDAVFKGNERLRWQ